LLSSNCIAAVLWYCVHPWNGLHFMFVTWSTWIFLYMIYLNIYKHDLPEYLYTWSTWIFIYMRSTWIFIYMRSHSASGTVVWATSGLSDNFCYGCPFLLFFNHHLATDVQATTSSVSACVREIVRSRTISSEASASRTPGGRHTDDFEKKRPGTTKTSVTDACRTSATDVFASGGRYTDVREASFFAGYHKH
jgi:hypothetical protein